MITLRRILVPVDFSQHSDQALKYAVALAEKFGAELFLIHVFQDLAVYQTEVVSGAPPIMPPETRIPRRSSTLVLLALPCQRMAYPPVQVAPLFQRGSGKQRSGQV